MGYKVEDGLVLFVLLFLSDFSSQRLSFHMVSAYVLRLDQATPRSDCGRDVVTCKCKRLFSAWDGSETTPSIARKESKLSMARQNSLNRPWSFRRLQPAAELLSITIMDPGTRLAPGAQPSGL